MVYFPSPIAVRRSGGRRHDHASRARTRPERGDNHRRGEDPSLALRIGAMRKDVGSLVRRMYYYLRAAAVYERMSKASLRPGGEMLRNGACLRIDFLWLACLAPPGLCRPLLSPHLSYSFPRKSPNGLPRSNSPSAVQVVDFLQSSPRVLQGIFDTRTPTRRCYINVRVARTRMPSQVLPLK